MEHRINPRTMTRGSDWRWVVLHQLTTAERTALGDSLDACGLDWREHADCPYVPVEFSGREEHMDQLLGILDAPQPELAELITNLIRGNAPACFRHASGKIPLDRPLVMGVINTTPDSFSDGGQWLSTDAAVTHGLELVAQGADILDIGGESTRPGAAPVSAAAEMDRVLPAIERLARETDRPISIDTSKASVAREALTRGAVIVNDVTGFHGDPDIASVVAEAGAGAVLMHLQGVPQTMQSAPGYDDLLFRVTHYWRQGLRLAREAGIADEQILLDPGIGFGKTLSNNLELLRRLPELGSLGHGLLLGTSRKSFIKMGLEQFWDETPNDCCQAEPRNRIWGTAASVACAVAGGVAAIRVHDVAAMRQVADLAYLIRGGTN